MSFLSLLLTPAALSALMWGCFIVAALSLALSAYFQRQELKRQNEALLVLLRQIAETTGKR